MLNIQTTAKWSYFFIAATLFLVGWLNLTTPFVVVLFSIFALRKLRFGNSKLLSICFFFVLLAAIGYGFVFFLKQAISALPAIAEDAVPKAIAKAKLYNLELPFTDLDELKTLIIQKVSEIKYLGNVARIATKETALVIIGFVVAVSLFINSKYDLGRGSYAVKNNLYTLTADHIARRFRTFYASFEMVMGAQILISLINTALTSVFILSVDLKYAPLIIVLTFLCGLLPIVGNLISNTIITGVALTVSAKLAGAALIFLIVLHKLEYFLNSKIIGDRIKNPMWLTLLAIIIGERLMGIPGMILAPVVLHYLKIEASAIEVPGQIVVTDEPAKETRP